MKDAVTATDVAQTTTSMHSIVSERMFADHLLIPQIKICQIIGVRPSKYASVRPSGEETYFRGVCARVYSAADALLEHGGLLRDDLIPKCG